MVECGGLENRFTGNPGDEGSNPSSSASFPSKRPSLTELGRFFLQLRRIDDPMFHVKPQYTYP